MDAEHEEVIQVCEACLRHVTTFYRKLGYEVCRPASVTPPRR